MSFSESQPQQGSAQERVGGKIEGEYSLDKWRAAPEETLTPEEREFVDAYSERVDQMIERVQNNPSLARAIMREERDPELTKKYGAKTYRNIY